MENIEVLNNNNNINHREYNKDEMEPPKWMDTSFLETILKKVENVNKIEITEPKFSPGSFKGDHFASVMFRAELKYKFAQNNKTVSKSRSIIIKSMPEIEGIKKEMLEASNAFDTEIEIYSEIIPKFKKALRDINVNRFFAAEMLYSALKPRKIVVFEDLKALGYKTFDEKRFFRIEESKVPFRALAIWHALSYKFANEGDKSVMKFQESMFDLPDAEGNDLFVGGIDNLVKFLSSKPNNEIYVEKLQKIKKPFYEKCFSKECYDDNWNVLTHGDFHLKNMMFRFDKDNKIEDVVLLDYQITKYTTAAHDLLYGLYMICDAETRRNHRDELIYFYYTEFIATLKKLNYNENLPTLTQLHRAILNYGHFELYLISTFLPMVSSIVNSEIEPELLIGSTDARLKCFYSPNVEKQIAELLPNLLYKGYLDDY